MDIEKVVEGGIITGAGALIGTASNTLPEKYKNYGYLAGGAIGLYGLSVVAKGISEPGAEIPPEDIWISDFEITEPVEGEVFYYSFPRTHIYFTYKIINPMDKKIILKFVREVYKEGVYQYSIIDEINVIKNETTYFKLLELSMGIWDGGNYKIKAYIMHPRTAKIISDIKEKNIIYKVI